MYAVEVKSLRFSYGEKVIFDNFDLKIEKGCFTTILGDNGSGKSTLVKILFGDLPYLGEIYFNDIAFTGVTRDNLRTKIGAAFDLYGVSETVFDEIAFPLENMNMDNERILCKVNEIAYKFGLDNLLSESLVRLSLEERTLVSLASSLVYNPEILFVDGILSYMDNKTRMQVLDVLKEFNKNGMTVIIVTSSPSLALYGDSVIYLKGGKVLASGSLSDVFSRDDVDLPFIPLLSHKLEFYGLVSKTYLKMKDLVDDVWK